ncbi:MAG: hypothetical protein ABWY05_09580 [Noviherbaspirillum sp.]
MTLPGAVTTWSISPMKDQATAIRIRTAAWLAPALLSIRRAPARYREIRFASRPAAGGRIALTGGEALLLKAVRGRGYHLGFQLTVKNLNSFR